MGDGAKEMGESKFLVGAAEIPPGEGYEATRVMLLLRKRAEPYKTPPCFRGELREEGGESGGKKTSFQ